MTNKVIKRAKKGTVSVKGTITEDQRKIIESLVGPIGSNQQDVVGKIIVLWLYNEGYLKKINEEGGEDGK